MANDSRTSLLCPNCHRLVSAQAKHCLHCGTANPGAWWKNNRLTRGLQNGDAILRALLVANIGMYIVSLLQLDGVRVSGNPLAFLSPSNRSLLLLGATGTIPIDQLQRWWTLLSASYLHGGILHIVFNMMALRQLVPFVASEYGPSRLVIIYTVTGIVGFAVSYAAGIQFTIGASAAVCGLIGAALYFGKSRGGAYGTAIYRQVGGWALTIFLFGFLISGINNWAHGGGMVSGALCGYWLNYQERAGEPLWHKGLASVCIVVPVLVLAWALVASFLYGWNPPAGGPISSYYRSLSR